MTSNVDERKRIAILPARGGSKRIPRKNILDFAGKPMIAHPLIAAVDSGFFDRIHVSTDDQEIAAIAEAYGADCEPQRPVELSDDITPILPVVRWALEDFAKKGEEYDDVFILFPCSPFLEVDDLRQAYKVYSDHGHSKNLLTVARAPAFNEWYYRRRDDGRLDPINPGGSFIRGQNLEPAYYETGTFTIFPRKWFSVSETLEDDTNYISFELPQWKAVDIDDLKDLEFAKLLYDAKSGPK